MSMTPEREKEIRDSYRDNPEWNRIEELLTELDETRAKLEQVGKDKASNDDDYIKLSAQWARTWKKCEQLKRIIARELTENDELGSEFVYVNVLRDRLAHAEKVVEAAREGIIGNNMISLNRFLGIRNALSEYDASKKGGRENE